MAYFPLFISLEDFPCLVIGGGRVALRKITLLLEYGARVMVAAPEILPEIEALPNVTLVRRKVQEQDLEGKRLVFAAASDRECNHWAAELCRARNIPVNVADVPGECDFYFPALVRRGDVVVGVSTGGTSPGIASAVRKEIEQILPEDLGAFADETGKIRTAIMEQGGSPQKDSAYQKRIEDYFQHENHENRNPHKRPCQEADGACDTGIAGKA
jgi:siroheme synthase-like protein